MGKIVDYQGEGDPKDFAPDFQKQPEPYGTPLQGILTAFDSLPDGASILDIAGGYGRYAIPLAEEGFAVTIVDMHQASLDEAERRAGLLRTKRGAVRTVHGDVIRDDLPIADSFDAVTCVGFMHHLNPLGATALFETMTNYTKSNGRVILEFSTNKHRRLPSGEAILVDGVPEQNMTLKEGLEFVGGLYRADGFTHTELQVVPLIIRQPDFWYDADVIIASGKKPGTTT